jgi:predicted XRE-type DNA-binding protein
MQDALKDGTKNKTPSGEENYNATVSNDQVKQALALKNSSLTQKEIASLFGVNQSQISRWFNKKTRSLN